MKRAPVVLATLTLAALAARLADELGKQIGRFAVAQDWIAPNAVN